jgi:hypothetical protein
MSEHDPKSEEHVEDLDVPESESEEVKGGLLPASGQLSNKVGLKFSKIQLGNKVDPGSFKLGDGSV